MYSMMTVRKLPRRFKFSSQTRLQWSFARRIMASASVIPGKIGEMKQVVVSTVCLTASGELEQVRGQAQDFSYRRSTFSDGRRLILGASLRLRPGDPTAIRARMEELSARRKEKQPLEYPSAGSTFKRPEGQFAAALIDRCGLKGCAVGGAQVSEKHAGFVINRGGATCGDVLRLIEHIQQTVFRQTGVALEPEVKLLGR